MVTCLEQGENHSHMVQPMPLPPPNIVLLWNPAYLGCPWKEAIKQMLLATYNARYPLLYGCNAKCSVHKYSRSWRWWLWSNICNNIIQSAHQASSYTSGYTYKYLKLCSKATGDKISDRQMASAMPDVQLSSQMYNITSYHPLISTKSYCSAIMHVYKHNT